MKGLIDVPKRLGIFPKVAFCNYIIMHTTGITLVILLLEFGPIAIKLMLFQINEFTVVTVLHLLECVHY